MSWYEAAAYAEFAGKSLPTLHHWYRAADLTLFSDILALSNFGGQGPRPVGAAAEPHGLRQRTTWRATCASGPGTPTATRRYTLGGAWSDPTYLYTGPDALDPMDRSPILGLRCALYEKPPPDGDASPSSRTSCADLSNEQPGQRRR